MYSILTKFVKDCNTFFVISNTVFCSKHSTQHAVLDIVNTILQDMDNSKFSFINHEILLAKLEKYGVGGKLVATF